MDKERAGGLRAKQLLWLIGVPVIMLLIGIWQFSRVESAGSVNEQIAQYQEMIKELDAIQAKDRRSIAFVTDEQGKRVPVTLIKDRLQKEIRDLESGGLNSTTRGLQMPLASVTIACSVLALLWSGLGLAYQRSMGAQAMRSREQLLAAFLRGKGLLPAYMVVMVVLLFGAAIALMVYELMPLLRHQRYSKGDMKLMFVIVAISAGLLYYSVKILIDVIRAARRPMADDPVQVMGQIVTREQTPKLWSFVGKVAQRIGADTPDAIVVGLNEGFFVTEHPVQLASGAAVPKGRVLYLPLPYMAFMNASEVAAVIGHELGHFMGEDTVYSQRFSPIYTATIRHLNAVAGANDDDSGWRSLVTRPATIFGELFLDSFHEAVRFWSRKRELAADAVGAQVAGAQAVAASLLRITALEPHVAEALTAHWDSARAVAGGVLGHVRQLVATKGMVDPSEHLQNRQSHPFDTHPELVVRLEAVGMPMSGELRSRAMEPAGSNLLQEFGLEAQSAASSAQTAEAAAQTAAPAVDVSAALQSELTSAAAANRQAKIDELSALVRQAQGTQPVFERMLKPLLGVGLIAALSVMMGIAALTQPGSRLIGIGLLAFTLALIVWGAWLFKRGRKPALVLQPGGLQLFNQPEVLPWSAINDFGFTETNHTFVVRLELAPQTPAPKLGVSSMRGRYYKAKHHVEVTMLGLGGKRAEQAMQTIVNYWRAFHARVELQRMGVMV